MSITLIDVYTYEAGIEEGKRQAKEECAKCEEGVRRVAAEEARRFAEEECSQAVARAEAEIKVLKELVNGAKPLVEIYGCTAPTSQYQVTWKRDWLERARRILK